MEKTWLTIDDAAAYLDVSRTTIYKWARQGKLTIHKVGKTSRVKKGDLDELFENGGKVNL